MFACIQSPPHVEVVVHTQYYWLVCVRLGSDYRRMLKLLCILNTICSGFRLLRRDLAEKVNRVIMRKLGHLHDTELGALRGLKSGQSVHDFIQAGILSLSHKKGRLSTTFWIRFYEEFPIDEDQELHLPDPAKNDTPDLYDRELLESMKWARKKNPVERTPKPLAKFLDRRGNTCIAYDMSTFACLHWLA